MYYSGTSLCPYFFVIMVNTWPLVQSSGEMNHQGYALCCDLGELDVNMHVLLLFKID